MIDYDGMLRVIDRMTALISSPQNYITGERADHARDGSGNRVFDFAKAASWSFHGAYLDVALFYNLGRKERDRLIRRFRWASSYKADEPFFDYALPHAETMDVLRRTREIVIQERNRSKTVDTN